MEFTQGAKDLIEKNIRSIMEKMTLGDKDRPDVEKELRSGFFEGAETKARERGATAVAEEDARGALADEGTPEEIAREYMDSYAGGLRRAGFWWRALAYIIDMLIVGVTICILASPFILLNFVFENAGSGWVVAAVLLMNLAIWLICIGVTLCYVVILEGRYGRTPGKYFAGLKVLKEDGTPIDYKDSLLRNVPKFFGNFILIDALIMVVFFRRQRQRGFDKVANTIVVHIKD